MLKFIKANKKEDFEHIAKWMSQEDAYLFTPSFLLEKKRTADQLWEGFLSGKKAIYLVEYENEIVGEFSIDFNFPGLSSSNKKTAWIGILFGEKSARGKGLGKETMSFLEAESKKLGAERIELGCFEYNINAIEFYKKLGYKEIRRIDKITMYQDKWWQDIRMEKNFE